MTTDNGVSQRSAVPPKGLHTGHEPESTPDDQSSPSPSHLRSPKHTCPSDFCRLRGLRFCYGQHTSRVDATEVSRCLKWISMMGCILTCEQSSSAFSSAAFRWLWSGWDSGVFSKIWDRQTAQWEIRVRPSVLSSTCFWRPSYVLYDERVAGDSLHGFEQEAGQRHSLTPGIHG